MDKLFCNPCVAERVAMAQKAGMKTAVDNEAPYLDVESKVGEFVIPACFRGVTLAVQWQSQTQFGQMLFGAVAVPVCVERHLVPQNNSSLMHGAADIPGL